MTAQSLLTELRAAGIAVHADDGLLRLDAPVGTLTPDLVADVKSCKQDLLKILPDSSLLPQGLSGSGSRSDGAASVAQAKYTTAQPPSKADVEWRRFLSVAQPTADGSGWFDPVYGTPEMPSGFVVPHPGDRTPGVPRGWTARSWIGHLRYMGNACATLNPEQSADYLSKAEQLEDHSQCLIQR